MPKATAEEMEETRRLVEETNMPYREIAEKVGRGERTITTWATKHGWDRTHRLRAVTETEKARVEQLQARNQRTAIEKLEQSLGGMLVLRENLVECILEGVEGLKGRTLAPRDIKDLTVCYGILTDHAWSATDRIDGKGAATGEALERELSDRKLTIVRSDDAEAAGLNRLA